MFAEYHKKLGMTIKANLDYYNIIDIAESIIAIEYCYCMLLLKYYWYCWNNTCDSNAIAGL